jgi:predicted DNA-binding transcriptional regulator AlpA
MSLYVPIYATHYLTYHRWIRQMHANDREEQFMTEREVAQLLNRSVKTLRNDRSLGRGPKFVKLGRAVRYRPSDVLEYVNSRLGGTIAALLACLLDWMELFGVG